MQVYLSSGKYDIIASGETFLFGPFEDLTIEVNDGNEALVRIILKFVENSSCDRGIETDIANDSLVITCINFSSLGTGLKCPTHIADVNGKEVYFMFSSSYLGEKEDKARSVKYTVFWKNKMKE